MLSRDVILKDWDGEHVGSADVIAANLEIFSQFPNVIINVIEVAASNQTILAELLIKVDEKNTLEVVDVFKIEHNLIQSISAYKI